MYIYIYVYIYIHTCIDLDDFDIFLLPSFLTLILVSPSNARVRKLPTSGIQAAISVAVRTCRPRQANPSELQLHLDVEGETILIRYGSKSKP